jgi:FkbM family methyltransferase
VAFLKNKIYTAALKRLRDNESDISYFLKELRPMLQRNPGQYTDFFNSIKPSPVPGKKFAPDQDDKYKWLDALNIKTVLDVGAWEGDSVKQFTGLFPEAAIYSFEPIPDTYKKLKALEKSVPRLKTFNCALGDKEGVMEINRSEFSPSSSLLKMEQSHKDAFPFTAGEWKEEVKIKTLDSFQSELDLQKNVLLKIDVQGFEEHVLKGARAILKEVKVIIIELSFVELYAGQPMFDTIYTLLRNAGFIYSGSWHQLLRPQDGTILQQNGVFLRP